MLIYQITSLNLKLIHSDLVKTPILQCFMYEFMLYYIVKFLTNKTRAFTQ